MNTSSCPHKNCENTYVSSEKWLFHRPLSRLLKFPLLFWYLAFVLGFSTGENDFGVYFRWIQTHWMDRIPSRSDASVGRHCQMESKLCMLYLETKGGIIWFVLGNVIIVFLPSTRWDRFVFIKKCWKTLVPVFMFIRNVTSAFCLSSYFDGSASSFVTFFHSSFCGLLYLNIMQWISFSLSKGIGKSTKLFKYSPIVIMNIPFRKQCALVTQNAVNEYHRALFIQNGCTQYFKIVQLPDTFVWLCQMGEFDEMIIGIPIEIFLVERCECFAGNQMLENEVF